MSHSTSGRVAAAALALTGILHLALAPEYLGEQAYIGILFIAGGIFSLAVAGTLWFREQRLAWVAGGLVCLGMATGFILSRTVGLPGFHESEWELSGLISVLLELIVFGLAVRALGTEPARSTMTA